MAPLPQIESLTLKAIKAAWEAEQESWDSIGISMSDLGSDCDRAIWNNFRWVTEPERFTARQLRLFETGHEQERRLLRDLRKVPGVTVLEVDPDRIGRDGKPAQFKVYSHGGHVRGKLDGKAIGLPDAPKTWHIVECKSHNEKNFALLVKHRDLKKAKIAHWWQCQKYMEREGLTRCLYMGIGKNDDDWYLERIEYDAVAVAQMDARLERIINSNRPPPRIQENPDKWPCMMCKHVRACHSLEFGRQHCRTCLHSTPVITEGKDAIWHCAKHDKSLSVDEQRAGCDAHLYLPDVVPGDQIDAGDDWVAYTLHRTGERWVDQEKKPATEPEHACEVCGDSKVEQINAGHGNVVEAPCSYCVVCGEKQIDTPSGMTCANGHGGAPALEHDLYKNGDADAPDIIKDRNGEVALQLCRRCGKGERELYEGPCEPNAGPSPAPQLRYWWHPESGSLWSSYEDEMAKGTDGCLEELDSAEYEQAKAWLASQTEAAQ